MRAKANKIEEDKSWEGHTCRDCAHCTPYTKWETLTVKDRQPTMGICPHNEYKVLLSQKACKPYFKRRNI